MAPIAPGGDSRRATMHTAATATDTGEELYATNPGGGGAFSAACFQVAGTFVGTITFQATVDGSNWSSLLVEDVSSGATSTTATSTGIFRATVLGLMKVRANITAYTSGSISVTGLVVA